MTREDDADGCAGSDAPDVTGVRPHWSFLSHYATPVRFPSVDRMSLGRRAKRMTCHTPARTGRAVLAGWDLD